MYEIYLDLYFRIYAFTNKDISCMLWATSSSLSAVFVNTRWPSHYRVCKSLLQAVLDSDIVDVVNHFLRLSKREIWGFPRLLFPTSLPWIINIEVYYTFIDIAKHILCIEIFALLLFSLFKIFIHAWSNTFVIWLHKLIFNTLRYIKISNAWIRLIEHLDRAQVSTR